MDNSQPQVLFVDEQSEILDYFSRNLRALGYETVTSTSWDEAKSLLRDSSLQPDIILIEPLSELDETTLQQICAEAPQVPVVIVSSSREPEHIVTAIKAGAKDYIVKPFDAGMLERTIVSVLESQVKAPPVKLELEESESQFVFSSAPMQQVHQTVMQIADINVPVLIQGESGVGKDVVARLIHQKSSLHDRMFVKVNCAAMPTELVESELFGYRKGAFTGAHADRPGKFEFANAGTIFLDEIGEFTPSIQAKLLQVLQEGRFTRLGSNRETHVDVRIIAATNQNLEEAISKGAFREDLYYRLNVVNIEVPALRKRPEEVLLLAKLFLEKYGTQYRSSVEKLPKELESLFCSYHWPGNVRELENLIKRYVVLGDAESIRTELENKMSSDVLKEADEFAEHCLQQSGDDVDLKAVRKKAASMAEKRIISKALHRTRWNKWKAAQQLKVSYKTLLAKIQEYEIES